MLSGIDTRGLLDSLLQGGRELAQKGSDYAAEKLNVGHDARSREGFGKGLLGGAVGAGVLSLLLGTEAGRKIGGTGLALGSIAALGKLALDKWQEHQSQTAAEAPREPPVDRLSGSAADARARALISAMIAAAKADGHMDEAERAAIKERLSPLGAGASDFLFEEMAKPADPEAVARDVHDPQAKAEVYAVSALVCGTPVAAERAYLDRLAVALGLPAEVARGIEAELRANSG